MNRKIVSLILCSVVFTYVFGISSINFNVCAASKKKSAKSSVTTSVSSTKTSTSKSSSSKAESSAPAPAPTTPPEITSQTAIVADAETGYIYYEKGMHDKMYPASITKILTGLVAVERSSADDEITVTKEATKGITRDYANIALSPDEKLTMRDALSTMFLASANDSASAIAIHIAGSIPKFAELMNDKCKELGANDTHFANANGMPDNTHVTSAYDMALITRAAVKNEELMKYFGAKTYVMPPTNLKNEKVTYTTLHKMMKNTKYKYDGVYAGKTGYEMMSGHTLVTVAKKDGKDLICVVMKSGTGNACYDDTKLLLDYSFAVDPSDENAEYLTTPQPKTFFTTEDAEEVAPVISLTAPQKPHYAAISKKVCVIMIIASFISFAVLAYSILKNRKRISKKLQRQINLYARLESEGRYPERES